MNVKLDGGTAAPGLEYRIMQDKANNMTRLEVDYTPARMRTSKTVYYLASGPKVPDAKALSSSINFKTDVDAGSGLKGLGIEIGTEKYGLLVTNEATGIASKNGAESFGTTDTGVISEVKSFASNIFKAIGGK